MTTFQLLIAIETPLDSLGSSTRAQAIFWIVAGVFLLIKVLRGYQLGGPRQAVSLLAILSAYAAAYFGGPVATPFLRGAIKLPDFAIMGIAGSVLALLVFTVIEALSSLLCKTTADQTSPSRKLLYGRTGAALGGVVGLVMIMLVVIALKFLGTIAYAQASTQLKLQKKQAEYVEDQEAPETGQNEAELSPMIVTLVRVKNSLDAGPGGKLLHVVDPVPNAVYETMEKAVRVVSDQDSITRLINEPEIQKLVQDAKIRALADDPEIAEAAKKRNFIELLSHEKVIEIANDPAFHRRFKDIEFIKMLDRALAEDDSPTRPSIAQ